MKDGSEEKSTKCCLVLVLRQRRVKSNLCYINRESNSESVSVSVSVSVSELDILSRHFLQKQTR